MQEVLLASPKHLRIVPCNRVSEDALKNGQTSCTVRAKTQHRALIGKLSSLDVRVLEVQSVAELPDLAFTRDTSLMTPWGLIGLRPGAEHRRDETQVVLEAARAAGLPILGRVTAGCVEGGDVSLLRPGNVVIGVSGERTNSVGAQALGSFFERKGWAVIYTRVKPDLLHLDTHFCMLDRNIALGCIEKLESSFLEQLDRLSIEIVPVHLEEVSSLGCNVLSLGRKRILSAGSAPRVDEEMRQRGFEVHSVVLDEFTQCGGGVHCLTMPLRRSSDSLPLFGRRH